MNEWNKGAITAGFSVLAGVVAGTALEPIRAYLSDIRAVTKMRRQVYRELVNNYASICFALDDDTESGSSSGVRFGISQLPEQIRLEVFNHAIAKQDVYADIEDGGLIRAIYGSLADLKRATGTNRLHLAQGLEDVIRSQAKAGRLDAKLFLELLPEQRKEVAERLFK